MMFGQPHRTMRNIFSTTDRTDGQMWSGQGIVGQGTRQIMPNQMGNAVMGRVPMRNGFQKNMFGLAARGNTGQMGLARGTGLARGISGLTNGITPLVPTTMSMGIRG